MEAATGVGDAEKTTHTAIFDRRVTGSISLIQGHKDERRRTKHFAEETERFRKAINANPELAARGEPHLVANGGVEIAMDEQNHTELNETLRAILIGGDQASSDS